MLRPLARLISRFPKTVMLIWAAFAGAVYLAAPNLSDVVTQNQAAFLSDDAPSVVAAIEVGEVWPGEDFLQAAAVVFRREAGLTETDEDEVRSFESWLRSDDAPDNIASTQSVFSAPEFADALRSEDGKVMIVVAAMTTPPFQPETNEAVAALRERVAETIPDDLDAHVTGNAGVAADQALAIDASLERTTVITLVLVTAILVWVYRSPIAPLVPLVTIGFAYASSRALVALLGGAGLEISSLVENFMVVIVFGAGTDYCLFIVSRYKEELAGIGTDPEEQRRTLIATVAVIGGVIAASAATVAVGFASQSVARFGMFRTMGPAMAISVLLTLAAGLTLTPALLALLGRWAFWPWRPGAAARRTRAVAAEAKAEAGAS
jgi:RND superfamily putative drug exporter